jgi:hypothetical protein
MVLRKTGVRFETLVLRETIARFSGRRAGLATTEAGCATTIP